MGVGMMYDNDLCVPSPPICNTDGEFNRLKYSF